MTLEMRVGLATFVYVSVYAFCLAGVKFPIVLLWGVIVATAVWAAFVLSELIRYLVNK